MQILHQLVCMAIITVMLLAPLQAQSNNTRDTNSGLQALTLVGRPKLTKTLGSTEDDTLHRILEDKAGNLWFATSSEGVFRFDGTRFIQFTKSDGLRSNKICSMLEDSEGNIWFGTDLGLNRFDGKSIVDVPLTGAYGRIYFPPLVSSGNSPAAKNEVWSMMQDKSGGLWFGTSGGLFRYSGTSFSRLLDNLQVINEEGLKLLKIQCMMQDSKGIIWFGSGLGEVEGLIRFDGTRVTSVKPKPDRWIRNILEDKQGSFWISTRIQGVWRDKGDGFARFPTDEKIAALFQDNLAMLQDRAGNIWFAGSEELDTAKPHSGIWRYDGTEFRNFNAEDGLAPISVFCMLEDRAGRIWLGSRNTGLTMFDGAKFIAYSE